MEETMKKVLKWIGIVLGSLIGLIVLVALVLFVKSRLEFTKKYSLQTQSVAIPSDAASVQRGKHLATILCMECHQPDLGGDPHFFEGGPLGSAAAPNLTPGQGGVGGQLSDADFVRAVRYGVKPDGTSVFIMPSTDFYYLSDQDLGAIIAYVRSVPPVDRQTPEPHVRFTFPGGVLYGAGMFGHLLRADTIQNMAEAPAAPQASTSADYGQYLVKVNGCADCHGQQLAGGKPGDPASPLAPNLTPGGELRAWSEADFIKTLRTGTTPSGTQLPNRFMPWKSKGQMTDDELKAVWAYLQSLPALQTSTAPAE
jgi:mono/diheme cytochrome c family protein